MKLIGYSHRCHSCISILLVASIIQTHVFAAVNDTNYSDEQLDETQKDELDRIVHPDASDEAVLDDIINYNRIVEEHKDARFKAIFHEDASIAKLSEGDLLLDDKDYEIFNKTSLAPSLKNKSKDGKQSKRGMIANLQSLWLSRVIPYEIFHPGTSMGKTSAQVTEEVTKALDTIASVSCLKFRKKQSADKNWLSFIKKSGCYSGIGRKYYKTAPTEISLGDGCITQSVILHEIYHALGFYHEQSREDRDSFVTVMKQNIKQSMLSNFDTHGGNDLDTQASQYDYHSIMHYGRKAFSNNGRETIVAKFDPNMKLGSNTLSYLDIAELNHKYQCHKDKDTIWSSWGSWTPCTLYWWNQKCMRIRQRFCLKFAEDPGKCPGADEYGVEEKEEECESSKCAETTVIPHWGAWEDYSQCSHHCGEGYYIRRRKCNNPPPKEGSKDKCIGLAYATYLCRKKRCAPKYYPNDADFENGFGPWRLDDKASVVWHITNTETPNKESGPTKPHFTANYAYLTSRKSEENGKAGRLISNAIDDTSDDHCVSFYYQLNGKKIRYLDFFIRTTTSKSFVNLWSMKEHQGNVWKRGGFTIPKQSEGYELIVEGKLGDTPDGDLAVDDIRIDKGVCVKGIEGCEDHYTHCTKWRNHGECHKNFRWMLKSCCHACISMAYCWDLYDHANDEKKCQDWAKHGECARSPEWMWRNCCNTCRSCVDYSYSCKYWAKDGWCEKSEWMRENCKSSCNICQV